MPQSQGSIYRSGIWRQWTECKTTERHSWWIEIDDLDSLSWFPQARQFLPFNSELLFLHCQNSMPKYFYVPYWACTWCIGSEVCHVMLHCWMLVWGNFFHSSVGRPVLPWVACKMTRYNRNNNQWGYTVIIENINGGGCIHVMKQSIMARHLVLFFFRMRLASSNSQTKREGRYPHRIHNNNWETYPYYKLEGINW